MDCKLPIPRTGVAAPMRALLAALVLLMAVSALQACSGEDLIVPGNVPATSPPAPTETPVQ